jgi:glycosyltransferase involved in cell wall biosynthesis
LHVVLDLHEGGLERVVTDLVLSSNPARTDARVLCLARRGRLADELPADRVIVAPPTGRSALIVPLRLASTLRSLEPDLVHVHSGAWYKAAYASRLAALGPIVFTDHGRQHPDPLGTRVFDRLGAALSDRIVAVSEPLAAYLRTELHIRGEKISVIPNGIRLPTPVSPDGVAALREELGVPVGVPILGTVGRLDRVKAQEFMLTAFRELRAGWTDGPPPVLIVAGDGPEREGLEQHANREGVAEAVLFLGWRNDIARLFELFDLFLLTSDSEGTSISLLEAMGAGCPVVATAVGGTPAVLGSELAGQLVAPRDVEGLVRLVRSMLSDTERRRQIGRVGHERLRAAYSVDAMVGAYDALYEELAAVR